MLYPYIMIYSNTILYYRSGFIEFKIKILVDN